MLQHTTHSNKNQKSGLPRDPSLSEKPLEQLFGVHVNQWAYDIWNRIQVEFYDQWMEQVEENVTQLSLIYCAGGLIIYTYDVIKIVDEK